MHKIIVHSTAVNQAICPEKVVFTILHFTTRIITFFPVGCCETLLAFSTLKSLLLPGTQT